MIEELLSKGKKYDNMGMIEVGGGNMKRSKGFTLIELLAVIVILAIIALIATPIILNIINDSREKSNQRSVEGLAKAAETTIGEIMMDSDYTGSDIVCKLGSNISDGEMSKDDIDEDETYCWDINNSEKTIKQVTYSGSRVKAGSIVFDKETGKISIANAQVGSSSKKYSTESNDSLIVTITSLATKENEEWIFTDPYGNIRYRGANPNNYVTFNDELWRIIGIVDGKVKLIRNNKIDNYRWYTDLDENGNGLNDWSRSTLMKLLNPGYDNEVGGSLYWNKTSDNCYIDYDTIGECDFSQKGLIKEAKSMIDETTWYLGGIDTGGSEFLETTSLDNDSIIKMMDQERGVVVYPNRPTKWTGYVGLMYPSDYAYAFDSSCRLDSDEYCTNNWIYNVAEKSQTSYTWMISPASDWPWYVLSIEREFINGNDGCDPGQVLPTVYLKTSVKITTGDGTELKPYRLSM